MPRKLIASYKNGSYIVRLYADGTKEKIAPRDSFVAEFPDSIDLKITNYCDQNCPMCHEKSSTLGKHASLDAELLKSLHSGTELAIGGGNPLAHPELVPFLERMKKQGIICNLTINESHFPKNKELLERLISERLIYGLGISIQKYNKEAVTFAKRHRGTVLHLINGIFKDYDKIADQNLKILILGYKKFGRGSAYYSPEIQGQMDKTKQMLPRLFGRFAVISFDNLAIEQFELKKLISKEDYDQMYMGDDGEGSMYIDLVEGTFARSSTSTQRYALKKDIKSMFEVIRKK